MKEDFMAIMATAAVTGMAMKEAIAGLKSKNKPRDNILQVSENKKEIFKVRVETPEVLTLSIQKSGSVCITLKRSGAFAAHVEGTISHVDSSGKTVYKHSYRSDKGGYKETHSLSKGDAIIIVMEAHHFVSAVVGQGSSEMVVKLKYGCTTHCIL